MQTKEADFPVYIDTGCMGSEFWHVRFPAFVLEKMSEYPWAGLGLRTLVDLEGESVAWTEPSALHYAAMAMAERIACRHAARTSGVPLCPLPVRTRWKFPGTSPYDRFTGMEADVAFHSGSNAGIMAGCPDSDRRDGAGRTRREALAWTHPPDLVIEIESPAPELDSAGYWTRIGVKEMWRLSAAHGQPAKAEILGLAADAGPVSIQTSRIVPGLDCDTVRSALQAGLNGQPDALEKAVTAGMEGKRPARPDVSLPHDGHADLT